MRVRITFRSMSDDPKSIVKRLKKSGMTESQIAETLNDDGVEVTQPTINRIATGKHRKTSFDIGMGLLKLQERRFSQRQSA